MLSGSFGLSRTFSMTLAYPWVLQSIAFDNQQQAELTLKDANVTIDLCHILTYENS